MKSQTGKLLAAVVLIAVAIGIYFSLGRTPAPRTEPVRYVCVATGERFQWPRDQVPNRVPAPNPSTGADTLLPAVERDGKLYASRRYAAALKEELAEANKYVDPKTLEVLTAPR